MINPTELRIGNLVNEKTFGACYVWNVHPSVIRVSCGEHPFYVIDEHPKNLEPIPLTEDWLKNFGFKKVVENKFLFINQGGFIVNYRPDRENDFRYRTVDAIDDIILKHVHQLQNLHFSIMGKELELKELRLPCVN